MLLVGIASKDILKPFNMLLSGAHLLIRKKRLLVNHQCALLSKIRNMQYISKTIG